MDGEISRRWGSPQSGARISAYKRSALAQNLGAGGIHFRRAFQIKNRAPAGPAPWENGMTDPFAVQKFEELFIPMGWTVK